MTESYYAGIYWPARPESAEECARRTETFFQLLARCDHLFGRWYEQADSEEAALQRGFTPDYETLLRLYRTEENPLGTAGFNFSAWTGHVDDGRGSMVRITCGDSSGAYPNCCVLHLPWPEIEPEGARVMTLPVVVNVLRAMVLAWEPVLGVVASDELRWALRPERDSRGFAGWLTYVSGERGEMPVPPLPIRTEPVEGQGSILVLTPERVSASNPEHLSLARRAQALLDANGLLRPVLS